MFEKIGDDIDACTIGVPDHTRFPIAMLAISQGKHIYVEKPLANTYEECELMIAAEKKYGVACQMGNQGHSGNDPMQFKTWVEAGLIKNVERIDAFMNSRRYDPGNWRSWYIYGNGAFGDWGPHILDTAHRFLELGFPTEVEAVKREGPNDYIFPQASTVAFRFPARKNMPACEVTWYDGTRNPPPRPDCLEPERKLDRPGKVIYGEDLTFHGGCTAPRCASSRKAR